MLKLQYAYISILRYKYNFNNYIATFHTKDLIWSILIRKKFYRQKTSERMHSLFYRNL